MAGAQAPHGNLAGAELFTHFNDLDACVRPGSG
jgi:hypothetical protein